MYAYACEQCAHVEFKAVRDDEHMLTQGCERCGHVGPRYVGRIALEQR